MNVSYVLPMRLSHAAGDELITYVAAIARQMEVIVVDGSSADVFEQHAAVWKSPIVHVAPDADLAQLANGKVAGTLTGLRRASNERVIVADDDVRYDRVSLNETISWLDRADVVRPQNYFDPVPWHACIDTARILLNRISGGDWPGTLAVRRSTLLAAGGYDGDVLFENLEMVRTVCAAGGTEAAPLNVYVRRLPPTSDRFWSQRVRQAYDELARPVRLAVWLSILPLGVGLAAAGAWRVVAGALLGSIVAAEAGRRRAGGAHVFPPVASLAAPVWIAERAVCAWLAIAAYAALGGVPYRGRIMARAATPLRDLQARLGSARA
jgi:hypothetical protein